MELTTIAAGDGAEVRAAGELDLASSARLYGALVDLREQGARRIRLDLSGLAFVDSAGVAALLRWQQEAARTGDEFIVQGARGLVLRLLRTTGSERLVGR